MKRQMIAGLAAAPLALGLAVAGAPSAHAATFGVSVTSDGHKATVTLNGCDPKAAKNDKAVGLELTNASGTGEDLELGTSPQVFTYDLPTDGQQTMTFICHYYGGGEQSKDVTLGTGHIAGVATENGAPVAGAVVTLFDAKGNQVGSPATSDAQGKVNFGPLADGDYYAKVVFPNGDVKYYKINVAGGVSGDWAAVDSIPTPANPTPAPANPGNGVPGLSNTGGSDASVLPLAGLGLVGVIGAGAAVVARKK